MSTSVQLQSKTDSPHSIPPIARVLMAFSDQEHSLFFPRGFSIPSARLDQVSTTGLDSYEWYELLRQQRPQVLVTCWSTPPIPENLLDTELSSLRYICHTTGSVRQLVPRHFLERGGLVTNWGNLAGKFVAEHTLLLILAGLRRVPQWPAVIRHELPWHPSPIRTHSLYGKRIGIHGFGHIARSLVALLAPFQVSLTAYSEGVPSELFAKHKVACADSLQALFAQSDVIVECEALNPQTAGSVTRHVLECLPEGALFVNVGRGAVVDEVALAALAKQRRISIALDVFSADPIPLDSPLLDVSEAILSPHIAGPTAEQCSICGDYALRNLHAYLLNKPLEAIITLPIYDRST